MDINEIEAKEIVQMSCVIPWGTIASFVESRPAIRKKYATGGFQLLKKNPSRFAAIMRNYGTDRDFNALFLLWYKAATRYHEVLGSLVEPSKYSEFSRRDNKEIDQPTFERLCTVLLPSDVRIIRSMSPISFTEEQLNSLKKIEDSVPSHNDVEPPPAPAIVTAEQSKSESEKMKELTSALKHLKHLSKAQDEKVSSLEKENSKLQTKMAILRAERRDEDRIRTDLDLRYGSELCKKDDEIQDLQNELHTLREKISKFERELDNRNRQIDNLKNAIKRAESLKEERILAILGKLDMEKLVASLNAPDPVLECLTSVVKAPSTDSKTWEDASDSFEDCLNGLMTKEHYLVKQIFGVNVTEVVNGNYFKSWPDRSDEFQDLNCILSTKRFICQSVYEILRQYYEEQADAVTQ